MLAVQTWVRRTGEAQLIRNIWVIVGSTPTLSSTGWDLTVPSEVTALTSASVHTCSCQKALWLKKRTERQTLSALDGTAAVDGSSADSQHLVLCAFFKRRPRNSFSQYLGANCFVFLMMFPVPLSLTVVDNKGELNMCESCSLAFSHQNPNSSNIACGDFQQMCLREAKRILHRPYLSSNPSDRQKTVNILIKISGTCFAFCRKVMSQLLLRIVPKTVFSKKQL